MISGKLAPGTPPRSHRAMITKSGSRASLASIAARSFPTISSNRDTAAAGAGFRRKRLVFNMGASNARLNVFPHGVMRTDGIAVASVGIREDGGLHGQDNF